jgi:hypothetical protein
MRVHSNLRKKIAGYLPRKTSLSLWIQLRGKGQRGEVLLGRGCLSRMKLSGMSFSHSKTFSGRRIGHSFSKRRWSAAA